jgi:hypothetical protein
MVRKSAKKPSSAKNKRKKPSESLEMFDSLFKGDLEMEGRQAERDKAVWAQEELSESAEMFDTVFREGLEDEDKKEKKPAAAKKKRTKSKPPELPPWKRRALEEAGAAEKGKRNRPKKASAGRGRVALMLLFLVLLAGAGLHYYGLVDFGVYTGHLKGLKTEAVLLYQAYAGKDKAPAEKDIASAIKKPIPVRPASQPAAAAVKHKAPPKSEMRPQKTGSAPQAVAAPAESKARPAARPAVSTVAAKSPGKAAPPPVSPVRDGGPAKGTRKKPVSFPYSIYLGSYSQSEYLHKAMRDYEDKGLFPFWVRVDLGTKGVWHRVFAGYFETGAEADAFIKEKGIPEGESRLVQYRNLIGTYASEKALQTQRAALVKLGFSPYVIPGGQSEYGLYVGAFRRKSFSEALKADLAARGIQSRIVSP